MESMDFKVINKTQFDMKGYDLYITLGGERVFTEEQDRSGKI